MKIVKYIITAIFMFCISAVCLSFTACNDSEVPPGGDSSTVKVVLSQHSLTLEKLESATLIANVEGEYSDIVWESTDSEVAEVVNGEIKAVKEGSAIIVCKVQGAEDRCIVTVNDNKLTLNLSTNIGDKELNLVKGDFFDVVYGVTYNKKAVDANIVITAADNSGIIELNDGRVTAKSKGQAKIVVTAEWSGISVRKAYTVNVVSSLTAKLYSEPSVSMYTVPESGCYSVALTPEVFEDGKSLSESEYQIVSFAYNEKIIDVNEVSLTVTAISKGYTELEVTFKSNGSSDTVAAVLRVNVQPYNQDKSDSIRIPDAYVGDKSYEIKAKEVFADLDSAVVDGLTIQSITDVTGSGSVRLKLENGAVDLSYFQENNILGERKWRIETEKYSYDVKIVVEKYNFVKPLIGKYVASNWDCGIEIKFDDRQKTVVLYDASTEEVKNRGVFDLTAWDEKSGRISISLDTAYSGKKEIEGVYWSGSGKIFIDLKVLDGDAYAYLYSENGAPYQEMAGVYDAGESWKVDLGLNADGTCVFDYNDALSKKCNGTYELTPQGAHNGSIRITIEKDYFGQTVFTGDYTLQNGVYRFEIYVNALSRKETLTQSEVNGGVYDAFAGYYKTSWLPMKLTEDRVVIFDYKRWGGNVNTTGSYELIGDVNSGKIIIDLKKPYCGNTRFEGTYDIKDGVYVFNIAFPGSGYDEISYTQVKA